jgi:hypothetical protein
LIQLGNHLLLVKNHVGKTTILFPFLSMKKNHNGFMILGTERWKQVRISAIPVTIATAGCFPMNISCHPGKLSQLVISSMQWIEKTSLFPKLDHRHDQTFFPKYTVFFFSMN